MASSLGVHREKEEHCCEQMEDGACELLSAISASINTGPKVLSESKRKEVIEAACRLQEVMETPEERVFRIMSMPNDATALGIATEMDLFGIAACHLDSTGQAIALPKLAAMSGADVHFLPRVLRFLAAHGLVTEITEEHFQITDVGRLLLSDQPLGGVVLAMSLSLSPLGNMLQYFRKHGFRNPVDGERGLWQDAHGSDQSFFRWLEGKPKEKEAFHHAMAGLRPNTECQWFEHFPVKEKLLINGDRMSLVDVGGSMGHDAKRLLAHYPRLKGRVCVLDLSTVIQDATAHDGI